MRRPFQIPIFEPGSIPNRFTLFIIDLLYLNKYDTDILKDLIELKDFILEKSPSCKAITLSTPTVRTDRENPQKNNENLTNRLKEQGNAR